MVAVGKPGIEADLGFKDSSDPACAGAVQCFFLGQPTRARVGILAGTIYGTHGCGKTDCAGGASGCWAYLYEVSGAWHYLNAGCAQATGTTPGPQDLVYIPSGCANVRSTPGLSGGVIGCLPARTPVDVDSAPVYADQHIWWHLAGLGWMAHDYLLAPKGS